MKNRETARLCYSYLVILPIITLSRMKDIGPVTAFVTLLLVGTGLLGLLRLWRTAPPHAEAAVPESPAESVAWRGNPAQRRHRFAVIVAVLAIAGVVAFTASR